MGLSTISAVELSELYKSGKAIDLIDVRTPIEFSQMHVAFARNIPLDLLDHETLLRDGIASKDEPVYIICHTGKRGAQACQRLLESGLANIINIDGGTVACQHSDLPIVSNKKVISLERQVRIAAGSLVVIGVVFGLVLHPAFIGISAFVGAGLIFAGVTDSCGMGLLLSKLPWNQRKC